MTGKIEQVEVITSMQRRRRWSADEKAAMVQETYAPGMSVSLVARRHGIAPNQLFTWRRLYTSGALSAVGAGAARRLDGDELVEVEIEDACRASPVAVSWNGSGSASNHSAHSLCKTTSSATASVRR
jgi:transposase-like protein